MTRRLPLVRTGVAAIAALLVAAPAAPAHGGFQLVAATQGPYGVVVRARPFTEQGQSKIDVTSYVVRQDVGEPDLTAQLQLELRSPDGTKSLEPQIVGDGYESIVTAPHDAWRRWTVTATVRGVAGTTTVRGGPVGGDGGPPGWLIPASVGIAAIAGGLAVAGRRRRGGDDDEDDWAADGLLSGP